MQIFNKEPIDVLWDLVRDLYFDKANKPRKDAIPIYKETMHKDANKVPESYILLRSQVVDTPHSFGDGNTIIRSADCDIILNGIEGAETAEDALKQIKEFGVNAYYYQFDVSKNEQVEPAIEKIIAEHGKIDILVNNAEADSSVIEAKEDFSSADEILPDEKSWQCPFCGNKNKFFYCEICGRKKPDELQSDSWLCVKCGKSNISNFCTACGTARPTQPSEVWICPDCGKENHGKFCTGCGRKR